MTTTQFGGLIPRGSLGLKLLLVCMLVLAMGVPLLTVGLILGERQSRANQVIGEIGMRAGGPQVVGGPVLAVPYEQRVLTTNAQNVIEPNIIRGEYFFVAQSGEANANLRVEDRRRGIYKAAVYEADVQFQAAFDPTRAVTPVEKTLDWSRARVVVFVRDSRSVRAVEARINGGEAVTMTAASDLTEGEPTEMSYIPSGRGETYVPAAVRAFAAPMPLEGPTAFTVDAHLVVGGAQQFSAVPFASETVVNVRGNRNDVSVGGYYQSNEPLTPAAGQFETNWRVPLTGYEDGGDFRLSSLVSRDMKVSFVSSDDLYNGVARSVRYGILFIGIVFMATLVFEAVSGKRAHPAQYVLVGLAQCVFYLLLLSMTEIIGFTTAFLIAAGATILLLAYYAGASSRSWSVGFSSMLGLSALYGAMYVLLTLEDFALLAGSTVAFLVIAGTMIATRRIDWYGRNGSQAATT